MVALADELCDSLSGFSSRDAYTIRCRRSGRSARCAPSSTQSTRWPWKRRIFARASRWRGWSRMPRDARHRAGRGLVGAARMLGTGLRTLRRGPTRRWGSFAARTLAVATPRTDAHGQARQSHGAAKPTATVSALRSRSPRREAEVSLTRVKDRARRHATSATRYAGPRPACKPARCGGHAEPCARPRHG